MVDSLLKYSYYLIVFGIPVPMLKFVLLWTGCLWCCHLDDDKEIDRIKQAYTDSSKSASLCLLTQYHLAKQDAVKAPIQAPIQDYGSTAPIKNNNEIVTP